MTSAKIELGNRGRFGLWLISPTDQFGNQPAANRGYSPYRSEDQAKGIKKCVAQK
jgi:hypothetical protein